PDLGHEYESSAHDRLRRPRARVDGALDLLRRASARNAAGDRALSTGARRARLLREAASPEHATLHLPVRIPVMKRRDTLAAAMALLLLLGLTQRPWARGETAPIVTGVDSIGMTVSDLERAVDFYTRTLGFEKASTVEVAGEAFERLQ